MCKLSIITINYNNATGLQKTMQSVLSQTAIDFEYIVVDGASTDGSYELICQYAKMPMRMPFAWVSEKDNGIYHAMNKGIQLAKGEYVQFVNSGDCLVDESVTKRMIEKLIEDDAIVYGNMIKKMPDKLLRDCSFAGKEITFLDMFSGTLNHSPAYIRRDLFTKYGLYDETLKICSDWKWYLQAIILGEEKVRYVDIDIIVFDMTGISNTNIDLIKKERKEVLEDLIPLKILQDYQQYATVIRMWNRINYVKVWRKLFWLIDRSLFRLEKIRLKKESKHDKVKK